METDMSVEKDQLSAEIERRAGDRGRLGNASNEELYYLARAKECMMRIEDIGRHRETMVGYETMIERVMQMMQDKVEAMSRPDPKDMS
jgi:hypothetical protein